MQGANVASTISRRHFILTAVSAAGGLMVGIVAAPDNAHAVAISTSCGMTTPMRRMKSMPGSPSIRTILILDPLSAIGDGTRQHDGAANDDQPEELHCDWSRVRIEYASSTRNFREKQSSTVNMYSHGSYSVRVA